jgi:tetratricopeptide (TPR) repeat protein
MKNKLNFILAFILCFVLFIINILSSNQDKIFALCAEYYFKNNNISKAKEFYEKAFDAGLSDTRQREAYINIIINSPLTIEAQEKLIKFLEYPQDDVARLKAVYFISDLKKEIHRKYPNNFITNAVFNQKIIHWGSLPITYCFENREKTPRFYIDEIEKAFTEWENALENKILFAETDNNPNIIIKFDENNPANPENKKYVVAYTSPDINLDVLKNMEIVFYLKDPNDTYFTGNQIYNTALHEIAHALGFMGHSDDKANVMYLSKDSVTEFNDTREVLTEADINTIKLLYKIKPQVTNAMNIKPEYVPNLVLGSKKEIYNEKIEEAQLYIKKAPKLPAGYISLAEEYVAIKDYTKAIKYLEKALKLADTDDIRAMIYYNLAVVNYYIDFLDIAKEYLEKSMQIKDTDDKHYLLGEIYYKEGNVKKSIEEYTKLFNKNPQNIDYTVALVNIYVINRDYLRARKILRIFFAKVPSEKGNPRFKPYGILLRGL